MVTLKKAAWIMENTAAYRAWQAPFLESKFAPIREHNDLSQVRRVLDVGCGPGSNCAVFPHTDYLGIDINPSYIEYARQKYGRDFAVADATTFHPDPQSPFDFVLLNSLLHHIPDEQVAHMLERLSHVVGPGGHIHIIDLVLPPGPGIPRYLALNDRGDHSRPLEAWESLFYRNFQPVVWQPFDVKFCGVTLWNLVYFKGRPRT